MPGQSNIETMSDPSGHFKPGERKRIYNSCESLRDKVLIRLLWKSGRRITEILKLKVKDINFQEGNILWHIDKKYKKLKDGTTKKNDMKRVKPIDSFTLKLLKHYIVVEEIGSEHHVLYSYDRFKHISRQRAYQIVEGACGKAGISRVGNSKPHPHHFRHTFAVNWAKNSTSPADIVKLKNHLEHSDLKVTETYLQFATEESREMVEMDEE